MAQPTHNGQRIPVLDISCLDAGAPRHASFLADLGAAARDFGFFYLVGHGLNPSAAGQLAALARRFFALPEAEKRTIEMVNAANFRGYTRPGWERTRGEADWREQLDIGPERTPVPPGPGTPPWARLHGPNQWPEGLPELREAAEAWIGALTALGLRLLRAFAVVLGQDEEVFAPIYQPRPNFLLKLIRYPGREATVTDQGVGPHKDGGFLTLLWQADRGGLQVEGPDGAWIDAPPIPGSLVVNIGELLELASDGYLKGTLHRALTPPAGTDRLSIGFFLGANLDSVVPALTLPASLAARARGVTRDPSNPLLREVGLNALKGRLRSHPDVARRHHADLLASLEVVRSALPAPV
jgi:isopenicillin N synthase-like dioxygenase